MSSVPGRDPDLSAVSNREEFAAALTELRGTAGLTVRQVVERSGALHGTVGGWFAGQHLPTDANERMFREVLRACGVSGPAAQDAWLLAVRRLRPITGRRRESGDVPYRGLAAFGTDDAEWFFGRTEPTRTLCDRIDLLRTGSEPPRVSIVIGASGSGKSSLLSAGLIPALRARGHQVAAVRPGAHPAAALATAPKADVLVVDQFEEAWIQCPDTAERGRFVDALTAPAAERVVVIGVRADYYRYLAEEPALFDALAAQPMLVRPLTTEELREVIVEPARKAGWAVDEDLVHLLTLELAPRGTGAAHDVGALPLLSHALLETWRHSTRRRMTVPDYLATGGISGAIQQSAEAVWATLTDHQHEIARRIFLRLITVDEQGHARRRVHREELRFADATAADVEVVIERFAAQRLLTVDQGTIEITHEALIGAWQRPNEWMNADRTGLLLHRGLTQAAQVWLEADRDSGTLLGGSRLALLREWAGADDHDTALNQTEREYLAASVVHHEAVIAGERRRTRILQRLVAGLAAVLVLAIVLAGVALIARSAAAHARDEAMSRQIALQAAGLRAKDPALAAQLALAAYRVSPTLEARSAVLDASAVHTPVRLLGFEGSALLSTDAAGAVLAVGRQDGSVVLYRRGGAAPVSALSSFAGATAGTARVDALAMNRTGGLLAVAGDRGIELWDISDPRSPRHAAALGAASMTVRDLSFTPDGGELVAGTIAADRIPRWRITDPAHPITLPPLEFPAGGPAVTVSADGRWLAAGGQGAALRVWDRAGGEPALVADIASDGSTDDFLALRFAPDGSALAAAGRARDVRRWAMADPARPAALPALSGFTSYVNDLAFSPDGRRLAAVSSDNTTRVWRLDQNRLETTLPDPVIVIAVRFTAGGSELVTGGLDGTARLWPLPGPALRGAQSVVFQLPLDRTGTRLLVGTGATDSTPRLWDLSDPAAPSDYPPLGVGPGEKTCGAVALAADGSVAAIGARSGLVYLWDLRDPRHPRPAGSIPAVHGIVAALAFSPDRSLLVALGQDDRVVTLWNVADPGAAQRLGTLDVGPGLPALAAIDAAGTLLAIATSQDSVRVWDIRDHAMPRELPSLTGFGNNVSTVAFAPRGALLAAAGPDRTVRLFDLTDPDHPRRVAVLDGPADAVITVNFSPDGRRLVGGGGGNGIWLWDIANPSRPTRYAVLGAYDGRINDAAYAHGGTVLVAAGPAMVVGLWDTDPDRVVASVCHGGSTPLTTGEWRRYLPGVPVRNICDGR